MPVERFPDTNVLMQDPESIFLKCDRVYICGYVLQELDKHKESNIEDKKYKARRAGRTIEEYEDKVVYLINECNFNLPSYFDIGSMDNKIISVLNQLYEQNNNVVALSNDLLFRKKCNLLMIPCEKLDDNKSEDLNYKGYKEITLSDDELAIFYESPSNHFELLTNEYLVIKNEYGEIVDKKRWNGTEFFDLVDTTIVPKTPFSYKSKKPKYEKFEKQQDSFSFTGKIKPRNLQQELAFDLFQNKLITCKVIFGKAGSGKDLIMTTNAISMVKQGIFDKIVFVRNQYEVANTKSIGYLKGTEFEKMLPYAMPLADHVGGIEGLIKLIDDGVIELQQLATIRGRDLKRCLVYVTEGENLTKEHIQLIIWRLGEGSALWINGDFKQVDDPLFERNSGLKKAINSLKGNELFGCIELCTTERSKTAELADLLD